MRTVHFVVPGGLDDPTRPSGGNTYDRHVCRDLGALDWAVHEHAVPGSWPRPDTEALAALAGVMQRIPDGALTLLDGLVASAAAEVLVPEASRLPLVMLVHMPLGHRPANGAVGATRMRERAVVEAAAAVVTTSQWSRSRVLELYNVAPDRVHVAEPGVDLADAAPGSAAGGELLCVANLTREKGHDVLVEALASISEQRWRCHCVGSIERDPEFVEGIRQRAADAGIADRVLFAGARTASDLDRSYVEADLMVLASRAETYGMVVTEALAHGLPVIATDVGGVTEALAYGEDGMRPGMLVPADDHVALAAALRAWLGEPELRYRLRRAAHERRRALPRWSSTAFALAGVLAAVSR